MGYSTAGLFNKISKNIQAGDGEAARKIFDRKMTEIREHVDSLVVALEEKNKSKKHVAWTLKEESSIRSASIIRVQPYERTIIICSSEKCSDWVIDQHRRLAEKISNEYQFNCDGKGVINFVDGEYVVKLFSKNRRFLVECRVMED